LIVKYDTLTDDSAAARVIDVPKGAMKLSADQQWESIKTDRFCPELHSVHRTNIRSWVKEQSKKLNRASGTMVATVIDEEQKWIAAEAARAAVKTQTGYMSKLMEAMILSTLPDKHILPDEIRLGLWWIPDRPKNSGLSSRLPADSEIDWPKRV
jgi:hypothetical protein